MYTNIHTYISDFSGEGSDNDEGMPRIPEEAPMSAADLQVYMCIHIYIYIYTSIYTCTRLYIYIYIYILTHTHIHTYMHTQSDAKHNFLYYCNVAAEAIVSYMHTYIHT